MLTRLIKNLTQVVIYDDCDDLALLLSADCLPCFGSSGVSALDIMEPVTAPMAITGKRSLCPPDKPNKRVIVSASGNTALVVLLI